MARKGKEPAGLRRYRLEQKRKKAARSRPKARKVSTMARRKSYRRRARASGRRSYRRKSKSVSIGALGGSAIAGGNMLSSFLGYTDKKKFFTDGAPIAILTGFQPYNNWAWDSEDFMKGGGPLLIGIVGGAVLSKVPVIKSVPKKIPIIGKYLRW